MTQIDHPDRPESSLSEAPAPETNEAEATMDEASFGAILTEFEQTQAASGADQGTVEGTVVSVTPDGAIVDIGRKNDGVLPPDPEGKIVPGAKVLVSIRGRDAEGNYQLSTLKVEVPRDWSGLQAAFDSKAVVAGTVIEVVKGGLRVDIGIRAFMPASRSGMREVADLPKLVGEQIECRITKLDTEKEDVVVDRRVVIEEREREAKQQAFEALQEGSVVTGTVRTVTDFGAFVDLGGVDGLLHVSDMTYARGVKPAELVKAGDALEVKILKINRETRKISLGTKQLQPDPWTVAAEKYSQGQRITGKVVRVADFGAFVELEPGLEGLIHVSEMSWTKRNVRASDVLKPGEMVEAVILGVNPGEKRIALGLKQALGDPWEDAVKKYPVGSVAEASVTSIAKFGAFVDLGGGIEGMIHIGDITAEKRLETPNEVLKVGQVIKAKVTEADKGRRRMRLSMKALEPTSVDEYLAEHKEGDAVTGRVVDVAGNRVKVELAEGVHGMAQLAEKRKEASAGGQKADLSAMTAMLAQKWKSGGGGDSAANEGPRVGQVRGFKISKIDLEKKRIDLEMA